MSPLLSDEEKTRALATLPNWDKVANRNAIEKTFVFADFDAAFAFMEQVAKKAGAMNHHPEWFNVYNRVEVTLSTHDAGGVSEKDIELARFMDGL